MANYRLYLMGSAGKQFHTLREFEAPGDDLAVTLVEDARGPEAMELWSGNKKVQGGKPSIRLSLQSWAGADRAR